MPLGNALGYPDTLLRDRSRAARVFRSARSRDVVWLLLSSAIFLGCGSETAGSNQMGPASAGAVGTEGITGAQATSTGATDISTGAGPAGSTTAGTAGTVGGTTAGTASTTVDPSNASTSGTGATATGTAGVGGASSSSAGGATTTASTAGTATGTTGGEPDTDTSWTIVSPGDVVKATLELTDLGDGTRLYYTVQAGGPAAYSMVLEDSPLGITRSDQDFVDGLSFESASTTSLIDETYTMLTGKRRSIRNYANERVIAFRAGDTATVELVLRAYDGGFAFQYRFPETSATEYTVTDEITGFKIPEGSRGWLLPYDVADMYTPAYENYWQDDVPVGTASSTTPGWCFPALFQTPTQHWVLLADTNVNGSYFAAHLARNAPDNLYSIAMPLMNEANGEGEVEPTSTLPWSTAWRMVMTGSLATVVESTMATDLADASAIADSSWVRPGRVSWSWWTADSNPTNYAANTPFVDLAQDMTWEYSLIDHGWHQMGGGGTWQDLVSYAASRNVGLMLWYNSGGSHNSVGLTPRDRINQAGTRVSEFQSISAAGIKGVKVDFFHADKPWMMQYYLDILRDAAASQLLVNFHGSTIPRGWQRTYPNLMTAEAARGAEWYKYDSSYAADQPRRNTILPFTRNVMASMDFTPVTFSNHTYPHLTTYGHELALSVVFESGLQHFADRVSGYSGLPAGPRTFLQLVPTTWDDTRLVEGMPGQWVVLARRKSTTWYLGGIAGDEQARDLDVSLSFLDQGTTYSIAVIADGSSDTTFSESSASLTAADTLPVSLRARGGFVATLVPN